MAIALDTDEPEAPPGVSIFTKIVNCVRVHNIPLINFVIIGVLGSFLMKLTTKYTGLYMKNSLITIIVTNLVLFGISETLAQTLTCYRRRAPRVSVRVDNTSFTSFNSSDIRTGAAFEAYDEHNNDQPDIERFIDYIQQEDEPEQVQWQQPEPIFDYELTYFNFNRLAGFMVWGFIMAFAQCWWYKFLQIYAADPKFIEVLRKVLTDQLCYSPVSLFAFFTYGTMVLESGSWQNTRDKLGKIYLKTLMINYSVWFPVQFINFLLVPRSFQVPFSSSISVLWNCFLSMRNSSA